MSNTVLIISALIIFLILIGMLIYGIYYIISNFQLTKIKLDIEDLWGICSCVYFFMDSKNKKIFSDRVKRELNLSIEEVSESENKLESLRIARLNECKASMLELYDKLIKKVEKSLPLAKEGADKYIYDIEDVVNIIKEVLSEV